MTIRIGVIGTGGIAQGHMERFAAMEGVELVAFCDVQAERAQAAAQKFGGRAYTDWRQMYDAEDLTALAIFTPPFAHGEMEIEACRRGLHLFIEKPVALDTEMARPILAAVQESGVITAVAYKYRWDDHVQKARQLLAGRTIGLVAGWFWGGTPGTPWWRIKALSGGQMVEQTTHIVDMARYLCGEITAVSAFYAQRAAHRDFPDLDVADVGTANILFESGALGNIQNCCLLKGWGSSGLRVMAHGFTLEVHGHRLTWNSPEDSGEYHCQRDGYLGEDQAFIEAVRTGDRSLIHSDYADAYKTLAVTVACNKSAEENGRLVAVSEVA
jgi:myo-inositol 2-dehydrogenase/D-chiro-inositol 1-dehydrogenase